MEIVESRAWGAALLGAVAALPRRGVSRILIEGVPNPIGDFGIHGSNPMVGSVPHRDFAIHGSRQMYAEVFGYGLLRGG